jgi:hypothetical protein
VARKLRFSLVLPVVQLTITGILTLWADRAWWLDSPRPQSFAVHVPSLVIEARSIWRGVNAPTFPFCVQEFSPEHVPRYGVREGPYLIAVVVLWFLVGRFLDRRRGLRVPGGPGIGLRKSLIALLVMAWGIFLLYIGLVFLAANAGLGIPRSDDQFAALLFILWSVILIAFSGLTLARGICHRYARTASQ